MQASKNGREYDLLIAVNISLLCRSVLKYIDTRDVHKLRWGSVVVNLTSFGRTLMFPALEHHFSAMPTFKASTIIFLNHCLPVAISADPG